MKLLKRAVAVLGPVVLIAMIVASVSPKAVHALVATAVQVVNTPDVRDADNPAKHPYASQCFVDLALGSNICNFDSVPAGFRLVIETFAPLIEMAIGVKPESVRLLVTTNGASYQLSYPVSFQATGFGSRDIWAVSQPLTRAYADSGTAPGCIVSTIGGQGQQNANCVISGYLVSVP